MLFKPFLFDIVELNLEKSCDDLYILHGEKIIFEINNAYGLKDEVV